MKCHCPACGRSTEIDAATLGFFARCTRCGVLLKAQLQEEEGKGAVAVRVIQVGRVREGQTSNGTIAELLSRTPVFRKAALAEPLGEPIEVVDFPVIHEDENLYDLVPAPVRPVTVVSQVQVQTELPAKYRKRAALREKQQILGMVTVFGLGLSALVAVGAIALKSRDFFVRSAQARDHEVKLAADQKATDANAGADSDKAAQQSQQAGDKASEITDK